MQPIVGMSNGCEFSLQYEISILLEGEVIHSATIDWQYASVNLFSLVPDVNLQPNTIYELEFSASDGLGEDTIISFTTGEEQAAGLLGTPSGTLTQALVYETDETGQVSVDFSLEPVSDPDNLSVIMLYNDLEPASPIRAFLANDASMYQTASWSIDTPFPNEVCLTAIQRDGKGQMLDFSAPFCATTEVVKESGGICAVSSGLGMIWFTPLLAIVAIRRRENPSS